MSGQFRGALLAVAALVSIAAVYHQVVKLSDLSDGPLDTPANGEVLTWSTTTNRSYCAAAAGSTTNFDAMSANGADFTNTVRFLGTASISNGTANYLFITNYLQFAVRTNIDYGQGGTNLHIDGNLALEWDVMVTNNIFVLVTNMAGKTFNLQLYNPTGYSLTISTQVCKFSSNSIPALNTNGYSLLSGRSFNGSQTQAWANITQGIGP